MLKARSDNTAFSLFFLPLLMFTLIGCGDIEVSFDIDESFDLSNASLSEDGGIVIDLSGKVPSAAANLQVKKATLTNFDFSANCTGITSSDITLDKNLVGVRASVQGAATPFFELAMPKGIAALQSDPVLGAVVELMPCTNLFEVGAPRFSLSEDQLKTINNSLVDWKEFADNIKTQPLLIDIAKGDGAPEGNWNINGNIKATLNVTFSFSP